MAPFAKYIVVTASPEALNSKVIYYLKHPEEETKRTEKAYAWVQKQSWERMLDCYISLWSKRDKI